MDNTTPVKKWYFSKTILLALAQFSIAVLMVYVDNNPTSHYAAAALAVKSAIDIVVRTNTSATIG